MEKRLSLAVTLSIIQVTEGFNPFFHPNFEGGHPQNWPHAFLSLPPTSREHLRHDGYLECLPATKELYIYKHLCLLRDSNPDPVFLSTNSDHLAVSSLILYCMEEQNFA
ncbi:hypothetical protein TNCV_1337011 [Trichonephila clavipes]|nr:hypothetical protein TNCV_1337011 [Trichonephila clavipes]